ncbi:(NiFe) hydrogenase maturation protein HypF [Desulfosporosinus orientis DSM 765]|uniref:Carbamoyltransferase n=1 Tax=Desulfosporosinus orientis (strain ATCC 19365 / DSM 765 / NCIMB 8382 / VKM B-1628 / Singapore I) TaxID=768706 RepID=G7WCQ1_DESOD|nr:carbamoyltransferase HypF [Desulfosporosinus orientis]AET66589.1 (NiFe) hydrogenase maturation protein HypF [Desulfosporosinus orientis DSM 765]
MQKEARLIHLNGIVQGVGFRPFVFKLAEKLGIYGWVNNSSHGVTIHAEGYHLDLFYNCLLKEAPPLAKIITTRSVAIEVLNYENFQIVESDSESEGHVLISPDVATCHECLKDLTNSKSRFYQYPFTNCTNCGPRYTIIRDIPYDRVQTTMSKFPMCQSCELDYTNPRDRRFHAQPVACVDCGPKLQLLDALGRKLPGVGKEQLAEGGIVAVKGLGGFHLVCDASNPKAVQRLRQRKERGKKPFAVMVRSVEKARSEVTINAMEEELLKSSAAPIVILERRLKAESSLAPDIAPGLNTLGMILPYTPVHHLLFEGFYDFLVMTSANLSGNPLIYTNEEAVESLQGIADYFLMHNRDIYHPCDDSVLQIIGDEPVFFRRARGYVPMPILMSDRKVKAPILGVGGELKNTFCLALQEKAFASQHIGDMEGYHNFQRFCQELKSFQRVVNIEPSIIAYDKHPNYQLTRFALDQPLRKYAVQHHHAHLVSVLGEWDRMEPTLGVICDGTGYGEDRSIWGFEFLYGNSTGYKRMAHLEYLGLPGGDAGVKRPLRIAYAYLKTLLNEEDWEKTKPLWSQLSSVEQQVLDQQLEKGFQVFPTSSAGRLFDAVSALLGVCTRVTYEGQAAMELESVATSFLLQEGGKDREPEQEQANHELVYSYEIRSENGTLVLGVKPLFDELVNDILQGVSREKIAYGFHQTIAQAIVDIAIQLGVEDGPMVLNGGVFQNKLLTEAVLHKCRIHNIKILRSRSLPPGDGGLAFGQVLIANEVL